MKKIYIFLLMLVASLGLAGCNGNDAPTGDNSTNTPTETTPSTEETETEKPAPEPELPGDDDLELSEEPVGFNIHYNRKDGKYAEWGVWLWADGVPSIIGKVWEFNRKDDYGPYLSVKFEDFGVEALQSKVGFIIRKIDSWTKDVEGDRFLEWNVVDLNEYGFYNIYLKAGDKKVYATEDGSETDKLDKFYMQTGADGNNYLKFNTNNPYSEFEIKCGDEVIASNTVGTDSFADKSDKHLDFNLGNTFPDLSKPYSLKVKFAKSGKEITRACNMAEIYKSPKFDEMFTYNGELGAIYTPEETVFRVWSPVSSAMKLRIYETGSPLNIKVNGKDVPIEGGSDTFVEYNMTKGPNGTWEYTAKDDLGGKYYTYVATNGKYTDYECVDPYAKSTGINGLRGMIVDWSKTNPEGWDDVKLNGKRDQELVVYETHVADVTSSVTWGGTPSKAKNFTGMYEEGTTYTWDGVTVKTGFDHIKELGVNTVQILPFFDANNNERPEDRKFNWGYDPLNYNSLDGVYSENPYDGYTKIREFKGLVQAYSNAGINIIMDVVYNHTAGLDRTNFDVLMPNYYYRYKDGAKTDASGCGSETASEMPMFKKFMIDSTYHWAKEFKLGGFRFDLMGIHDIDTMNKITNNLRTNVDQNITVYGEPWAAATPNIPNHTQAMQHNMDYFQGFGCFNDRIRDALMKGGMGAVTDKGWAFNEGTAMRDETAIIKEGIKGVIKDKNSKREVEKTVNYVTCHDNYTLYDRIYASGIRDYDLIKKQAMLAQSVVLTSQGINFMLAGEEFLRTKGGNHNSYNASYWINELDYSLKIENYDMFLNYKKLIALHNDTTLFSKDSMTARFIQISCNKDLNLLSYEIKTVMADGEQRIYKIVHANGFEGTAPRTVDLEGWTPYLDTLNVEGLEYTEATPVSSYQTLIAYKKA